MGQMRLYILADMEGISGIGSLDQTKRRLPEYIAGCSLMTSEVQTVVDEAFRCGATRVVVCDTHGGGGQLQAEKMDSRAVYETPDSARWMPSLNDTFDGLILLGQHARAGTLNGFLDHTISSASWFEYRLNDQIYGEIAMAAAYAGHYDVPVIMVTGDEAAVEEGKALLGNIPGVAVKRGLGRNRAECVPAAKAHASIKEAICEALGSAGIRPPFKPTLPARVRLTLYRSDMADRLANRSGTKRIDARTVERTITSFLDICPFQTCLR
jgi:D-amino peptidase